LASIFQVFVALTNFEPILREFHVSQARWAVKSFSATI
jgi:hypothetical protein